MKKTLLSLAIASLAAGQPVCATVEKIYNEPDSVYLFSYAHPKDEGRSGLKFAWSPDGDKWLSVSDGFAYLKCDFGRWGSEKRMIKPLLEKAEDGRWYCRWQLTPSGKVWGTSCSSDLLKWSPQQYVNAAEPVVPRLVTARQIVLNKDTLNGYIQKVPYTDIEQLIRFAEHKKYRDIQNNERAEQDAVRFAGLMPVTATIKVDAGQVKPISEHLVGIFFEDINYAADGGLYAELIQNRDFEYSVKDGSREGWDNGYAWSVRQLEGASTVTIASENPLHENNPHYAVLQVKPGVTLQNDGFDGISLKKGERYDFSLFARLPENSKGGKILVRLLDQAGKEVAQSAVHVSSKEWKQQRTVLIANADVHAAVLSLEPKLTGTVHLDMISLFPQNTFKGRKNGLRADLAQTLADLHPRFVRFPGGCVAHGDGVDNIYDWKGSIGALEERKPLRNLWGYHQTRGLGYHEYFLFCEDMGAEPVPVVAAGVPCQNSGTCSHHSVGELGCGGQQGGIPMEEMPQYVQDVLDLIEYANGDAKKTVWGKKRAQAGHPRPFNLKYIGIGNEDLITDIFEERFTMIFNAVKEKYPEVTVIGTVGPFYEGSDYEEGWKFASKIGIPMVDEHYYNTPGWFINNQDFYDRYDRNKAKVYLGEYAAHLPGRPNNIETALAEALYLTSVERNADVVTMTSYAPLLAKEGHTQWNPDLIYFNNTEVKPTVGYYAQQMYGQNVGSEYIASSVTLDNTQDAVEKRIGVSVVRDGKTGDMIVKLVNLLPVAVNAQVELPSLEGMDTTAVKTVLAGKPTDKQTRPVSGTMEVSEKFGYELPAYSFTVIRINKNKNNNR
ncbi:alpha-L-arabinofuranosidase C-terminal domain-containing protein [Phocaeicola sartorii]|uniref:alpha-L-arabinofuranosidase C-terminal domain-containing protein n=1 Tax=Phocaeicola sartorii TaxID=671267 RepID=UPI0013627D0E|nr:alpha-L-arabinofuranosidase C-terminal domain-containing protein [Phocaeicola sartorii]NBH68462.1 alpha-L-arabinofuranosidase [Phocaeicola sartorii]